MDVIEMDFGGRSRTVSFMPPPPSDDDGSLDDQLESVLENGGDNSELIGIEDTAVTAIGADRFSNETPLDEDDEILLGEEQRIADFDLDTAGGGFVDDKIIYGDDGLILEPDPVETLIEKVTMDTDPPLPGEPLLDGELVADDLDDIFTGVGPSGRAVREEPDVIEAPPETLPANAVPPGLVRERPKTPQPPRPIEIYGAVGREPTGAGVPVPISEIPEDDDGKGKKGFFKKLFGG